MKKVAEKLTKIAKMRSKKESSIKKTPVKKPIKKIAGEMEVTQLVINNKKRIAVLEAEIRDLRKMFQDAFVSKAAKVDNFHKKLKNKLNQK